MALAAKGITRLSEFAYEIPSTYKAGMRVPGIVFASEELMRKAVEDKAIEQVANVAFLPGIIRASLAMPDIHWGYGFPIGGVAATDLDGVVSPGGVGFDISCGVRLLRSDIPAADCRKMLGRLASKLALDLPRGMGTKGRIRLSDSEINEVLREGARWTVGAGFGEPADLETIEHGGRYEGASPENVSSKAKSRGRGQLGTIGSGNHFVEVQEVEEIFDPAAAEAFGLYAGQLVVMIHSGSRGLGHQVCTDYLREMEAASREFGYELPDTQLACAPIESPQGRRYMSAMRAAANFGLANRQCLAHWVRQSFESIFGQASGAMGMDLVYDVSHNVAQIERHEVEGAIREVCVHRKGATRAFGPGQPEVPTKYRDIGQPVMTPGDMGTNSYVLVGTEEAMKVSWGSTCHGAGRLMSRHMAKREMRGQELDRQLAAAGIIVKAGDIDALSEEAPYAYKDVSAVVDVCEGAGLSRKVAKLRPLVVVKG